MTTAMETQISSSNNSPLKRFAFGAVGLVLVAFSVVLAWPFGMAVLCDEPHDPATSILGIAMLTSYASAPFWGKATQRNAFKIAVAIALAWAAFLVLRRQ